MLHIHRRTRIYSNNAEGLPEWVFCILKTSPKCNVTSCTYYKVVPTLAELYDCGCVPRQAFTDIPRKVVFYLLHTIGESYEEKLDVPY